MNPLGLDDQLCYAVYSAGIAINRAYRPLLDDLGITYPQYLVLLALWEQDGQTIGAIAERLALESSTITPLVKRLEDGAVKNTIALRHSWILCSRISFCSGFRVPTFGSRVRGFSCFRSKGKDSAMGKEGSRVGFGSNTGFRGCKYSNSCENRRASRRSASP